MLRAPPKLFLYSCGWSEVPDHQETISSGLLFDISNVGTDYESNVGSRRAWEVFGGEGYYLDRELATMKEFSGSCAFSKTSVRASLTDFNPAPLYQF